MATPRVPARMVPSTPKSLFSLLFLIIAVATLNSPALVKAHLHSPPSTLEVYVHENDTPPNATVVFVVSPSAASGGPTVGFGTIAAVSNVIRTSAAADSLVLGRAYGVGVSEVDSSIYLSFTFALTTSEDAGTISIQGVVDALGNGEVGITTGTGDFRWARGYAEISGIYHAADGTSVYKVVFDIKYD